MTKNKWIWKKSITNSTEIVYSIPIERLHSNDVNVKRSIVKIRPKLFSSKIMNMQLFIRGQGCCANILSCLNIVIVYNGDITADSFVHTTDFLYVIFCNFINWMTFFWRFRLHVFHFLNWITEYMYHGVTVWCVCVRSRCMPSFHLIWRKNMVCKMSRKKRRRNEEPTTWQSFTSQCNI